MNQNYRKYALLMGVNVETILLLVGGWWGGNWLNENYPGDSDWKVKTVLLSLLVIGHSWYVVFRQLVMTMRKEGNKPDDT